MTCDSGVCNSVRAVFVGALFTHTPSVGWIFFQATETCPNNEKRITTLSGLEEY